MLMGMSPEEKKLLGLGMPSDYHYLTMVSPQLLFPKGRVSTCSNLDLDCGGASLLVGP